MKRVSTSVTILILFGLSSVGPAMAGDPTGVWLTEKGDAKIKITKCRRRHLR